MKISPLKLRVLRKYHPIIRRAGYKYSLNAWVNLINALWKLEEGDFIYNNYSCEWVQIKNTYFESTQISGQNPKLGSFISDFSIEDVNGALIFELHHFNWSDKEIVISPEAKQFNIKVEWPESNSRHPNFKAKK